MSVSNLNNENCIKNYETNHCCQHSHSKLLYEHVEPYGTTRQIREETNIGSLQLNDI